ncbi:MAG TPA: hypothetical protein VMW40_02530 [Candidatus Bathyarchaeia archaeon]|nr:hypothetical protein [Candidatus Bathyarchaeia archaeon]
MNSLESKEWYLWRRKSDKRYPWNRNPYIDSDFLKSEKKRINDVTRWMNNFRKSLHGASLPDVCYYVVPINIKPGWLAYFEGSNYICKGLSELRNCSFNPLIAFFPSDKVPTDYSLIRINSSKKIALLNGSTRSTIGEYAIIVDDLDELDSGSIYEDVPFESRIISKIIKENTHTTDSLAKSIAAPLISAPPVIRGLGGISFASILDDEDYSQGLNIALQMMLPPEYRSFSPPLWGIKGKDIKIVDGISIHLAEKIVTGRNYVSSVEGSSFDIMEPEKRKRRAFHGEYSILGALIKSQSRGIRLYEEMLHKFFESEITISNLSEQVDADGVLKVINAIDEDLWIQIARMRDKTPPLDISKQEDENYRRNIKADIDVILCERVPDRFRDIIAEMKVDDCVDNLKREAQSIARAENRETANLSLLEQSRRIFKDRLWMLEEDEMFRNIKYRVKEKSDEYQYFILKNILRELRIATAEEIYQKVSSNRTYRNSFKDLKDLKRLLNWSEQKYLVYRDPKNRYGLV